MASKPIVNKCQCENCQKAEKHPDKKLHHQINLLLSRLDEKQRRWYVAIESQRIRYGGDVLISQITGIDEKTIRNGRKEIDEDLENNPVERIREKGAGRPLIEKKRQ